MKIGNCRPYLDENQVCKVENMEPQYCKEKEGQR